MMTDALAHDELAAWPDALEQCVQPLTHFDRVTVLAETDSTQDAALRLGAQPGHVIVTGRQLQGRGRRGRVWDSGEDQQGDEAGTGVAMTVVLPAGGSERRAVQCAVAAARAIDHCLADETDARAGIKWPNDIIVDGRKVAGILVEQDVSHARVGIGINVHQKRWPAELEASAISLAQAGADVTRLVVMERLLRALDGALEEDVASLAEAYRSFDVLRGHVARFVVDGEVITGRVVDIEPLTGLRVVCKDGSERWLAASATSRAD